MGVYSVSKHAVVALSETLYHDLRSIDARVSVSLLCPAYVPTGIARSQRNRPPELVRPEPPTRSQIAAQAHSQQAVDSGKLSAAEVAALTFAAIRDDRFYILSHPAILPAVQQRHADIASQRNPTDPAAAKPPRRWYD
jgi:short-subunit dehydrogenase